MIRIDEMYTLYSVRYKKARVEPYCVDIIMRYFSFIQNDIQQD